ncbi:MAG: CBS domain-containing protein [Desulfobacterales bacterium]|nr:CBS domain-containing protein [Desulfobacterales bacterium]MCF8078695.1 CBS domain-containing protein [Desulfobacterales bacterium]
MKSTFVKDLMVMLDEYATVSQEASLYEAILSLENAQKKFDPNRHKQRAILVLDENGKVIGKVSMFDILTALEPKFEELEELGVLSRAGYSPDFIKSMLKENALWSEPLENICGRAPNRHVKDFMQIPSEGMLIEERASLDEAIVKMVLQGHQSLLVTRQREIVGILRLSDVFSFICEKIKACGF